MIKLDEAIRLMRRERGLRSRVAEACGISRMAVYQWQRVPIEQVHKVAPIIGMSPEQIRPDIFLPPNQRKVR